MFRIPDVVSVRDALARAELDGKGTLTQQVYVLLRRLAVDLQLLPNQSLSEKDVADSLRISRTPVREAFIRLSEDGVVRIVPKSGTYVSNIDMGRAEEGFFIWNALESSCVAQIAEKHSLRDIGVLRDLLARQQAAGGRQDAGDFKTATSQFHEVIFDIADFPGARKLIDSARFEVDRMRNMVQLYRIVSMTQIVADLAEVVNAIVAGEPEKARRLMSAHLDRIREAVSSLSLNPDFHGFFEILQQKQIGKRRSRSEPA